MHQHHRGGSPGERPPHVGVQVRDPEGRDRQHHRERGAGVDAQDPGVGERVAGQPLHQGADQPQRSRRRRGRAGCGRCGPRRSRGAGPRCPGRRRARSGERPPAPRPRWRRPAPRRRGRPPSASRAGPRVSAGRPGLRRQTGRSRALDGLGDLGHEVLDDDRDRQRGRVGDGQGDRLLSARRRRVRRRSPASCRSAGRSVNVFMSSGFSDQVRNTSDLRSAAFSAETDP